MVVPFPSKQQPGYSALQGTSVNRTEWRLLTERKALLLWCVLLLGVLCISALPRAPTGMLRSHPSSTVILEDEGGVELPGNGSLEERAEAERALRLGSPANSSHLQLQGAVRESSPPKMSDDPSPGRVESARAAAVSTTESATTTSLEHARMRKDQRPSQSMSTVSSSAEETDGPSRENLEAADAASVSTTSSPTTSSETKHPKERRQGGDPSTDEAEPTGVAAVSTTHRLLQHQGRRSEREEHERSQKDQRAAAAPANSASSQAEQQERRSEREERRRTGKDQSTANASGEETNAAHGSKEGSKQEREVTTQLGYIFEESDALAASLCTQDDIAYVPLDMRHHRMSYEDSAEACQKRCTTIQGCKTFTFYPTDKSCHVQDENTIQLYSPGSQAGKPNCNIFRKL